MDDRHESDHSGDDFWGDTPDWTAASERPRRERRTERPTDITGAIKNLWSSAMSAGSSATREHGVFDATAERPDPTRDPGFAQRVDATMFDDLDDDVLDVVLDVDAERDDVGDHLLEVDVHATTELPVVDVRRRSHADPLIAVVAEPHVPQDRRIDPLLARIGALAVVTTLLVPLGLGLRSSSTDATLSTTAGDVTASVVPITPTEPSAAPPATGATPSVVDPSSLPPAVPARSDTPAEAASGESSASEGSSPSVGDDTAAAATDTSSTESGSDGSATAADTEAMLAEKVCAVDYIVQSGDYWIGLAEGAGVPLAELLEANAATASTPLYPGADICLPAGSTTPTTTSTTTPTTTEAPTTTTPSTTPGATGVPDTTTAPTTTSTTTAPPVTSPAGPEDIKQIIRDVWPDDLEEKALQIAYRESRYVSTAQNFCCYGLFQIYWEVHDSWLVGIGVTSADQLFDPTTNARAAYALYQRAGGWGPWSQTNY